MYVYKITNKANGMLYIGITSKSIEERWRIHQNWARWKKPYGLHLAIKEFGADSFVIEHIASAKTFDDLRQLEKQVIQQYNSLHPNGYNKTAGGQGILGYRHTPEARKKMSEKVRAAGPHPMPREAIERSRLARVGQKRTQEQKSLMSKNRMGKGLLNAAARKYDIETLKLAVTMVQQKAKQVEIVKATGLSQSYVSNLMTGKRGITLTGV
jgi:group I intron endonuclease